MLHLFGAADPKHNQAREDGKLGKRNAMGLRANQDERDRGATDLALSTSATLRPTTSTQLNQSMPEPTPQPNKPVVLCVDDDRDIAELVEAILVDEGYDVSCLYTLADDALRRTVGRLEPDCVLLDGLPGWEYGSWESAAWLKHRARSAPVVMFTAHHPDSREAEAMHTDRARRADFAAVLLKPFHVDELLSAVATAVGQSHPFSRGAVAEAARTTALVAALRARGATEINPSKNREWASFRDAGGRVWQINWWQLRGVYQLGRYGDNGVMAMAGQFTELAAGIEIALPR